MKTAGRVFVVSGLVLIIVGMAFFWQGRQADKEAELWAINNSHKLFADYRGIELRGDDGYRPPGGGKEKVAGGALGAFGLLSCLLGAAMLQQPEPAEVPLPAHDFPPPAEPPPNPLPSPASVDLAPHTPARDIERQPCPDCGEMIAVQARLCRFCRANLT